MSRSFKVYVIGIVTYYTAVIFFFSESMTGPAEYLTIAAQ